MSKVRFPSVVSDVMNEIITVDGNSFISEAAEKMIQNKIGSIIITVNGKCTGIVTRSDMIRKVVCAREPCTHPIESIMTSPLIDVEPSTPILDTMRLLRDRNINQILVKSGENFVGIVSKGDLVRAVTLCSLTQFSTLLP
jgi:CBS domain-containing protein